MAQEDSSSNTIRPATQIIFQSNPMIVEHDGNTTIKLTTNLLNHHNYSIWCKPAINALCRKGRYGYVTESVGKLSVEDENYERWFQVDKIVLLEGKGMERKQCSSSNNHIISSSKTKVPKVDRKIVEKNRRNHMKDLYSQLNFLLSEDQSSKETLPLTDQIDEAINHIKSLEIRLKECKEKKERILSKRKRAYAACSSTYEESMELSNSKSPQIRIHEMGSHLEVLLTTGVDNHFIFCEAIRILQEDGADVVNANFSVIRNAIFHVIHAEIRDTMFGFGAAKITERLNRLVHGSTSESEVELQTPELWDFEIDPQSWEFLNKSFTV